jgi:hypothetical protein
MRFRGLFITLGLTGCVATAPMDDSARQEPRVTGAAAAITEQSSTSPADNLSSSPSTEQRPVYRVRRKGHYSPERAAQLAAFGREARP